MTSVAADHLLQTLLFRFVHVPPVHEFVQRISHFVFSACLSYIRTAGPASAVFFLSITLRSASDPTAAIIPSTMPNNTSVGK